MLIGCGDGGLSTLILRMHACRSSTPSTTHLDHHLPPPHRHVPQLQVERHVRDGVVHGKHLVSQQPKLRNHSSKSDLLLGTTFLLPGHLLFILRFCTYV